jgi:hypothetical protein
MDRRSRFAFLLAVLLLLAAACAGKPASTPNGALVAEWVLSDGVPTDEYVLAGTYDLEAQAVYLSDSLDCLTDPATGNPTNCVQPTLAPGQACDLRVTVAIDRVAEFTYIVLSQGRCRLVPGFSPAIPRQTG